MISTTHRSAAAICCLCLRLTAVSQGLDDVSRYNVSWDTPSGGSFGSMPLGNGDVGLNVWVEETGDLVFYVSKVDAFDSDHLLPKLGRVRLRMTPPLPVDGFRQILNLPDAAVVVSAGDAVVKLWVDANRPVICLEGTSLTPRQVSVMAESLRPLGPARDDTSSTGTSGAFFSPGTGKLAWCYRNHSSAWAVNCASQNSPAMAARASDPILHRTSGCVVAAEDFVRTDSLTLASLRPMTSFTVITRVLSSQPGSLSEWYAEAVRPIRPDWREHRDTWTAFWARSGIRIESCGESDVNLEQCRFTQFPQGARAYEGHTLIPAALNASQINQRYALERFCEAAAGRGQVPPPYNGSIFTMDMPAGVKGFLTPIDHPVSADERDWANLSFMWQNTRHPYWSMSARGDYDCIRPGMQFVRDGLEICSDRCRKIFNHEGAFVMEASWWHNVGVFNWSQVPAHLRYHQLATVELPAIMCEYYEHTREKKFLDEVLLPSACEFLKYYELHYPKRDAQGLMRMEGVGCVETYQGVTNPCTEIGGMKFVLDKLLSFEIGDSLRSRWSAFRKALPGVPLRRIRGLDLLAVGESYDPGRVLCESPELYTVYPFRQVWLGSPELLGAGRQSFHLRTTSIDGSVDDQAVETGGWQAAPVQAAFLGLAREAARLMSINFNDRFITWHDNVDPAAPFPNRPRPRFPAFWECKMDGTPDNDHGANSANALQSMLLQSDGDRIFLLPAWPEDWNVSFTLHASKNTTVECDYRNGRVCLLKVAPDSRRSDIVDMSSLRHRVRTLVGTALADRNYLFGLPPMLDALPLPGATTAEWIARFGGTIRGCKAGPWKNSVYRQNVAYVHILDWPGEGVELSPIPRRLVSAQAVSGSTAVTAGAQGWHINGTPDSIDTIVRLEFDGPLDDIAAQLPSAGSLTRDGALEVSHAGTDTTIVRVSLPCEEQIGRFELTIENPSHRRGEGRPFRLQSRRPDGDWKTFYEGWVYGTICGKAIAPVSLAEVRLVVNASHVSQFDLFAP
jgi:alpha-L-fucosidase 2